MRYLITGKYLSSQSKLFWVLAHNKLKFLGSEEEDLCHLIAQATCSMYITAIIDSLGCSRTMTALALS